MRTSIATQVVTFLGAGIVVGVIAFGLTAQVPEHSYLGPVGIVRLLEHPGFDPWTGMGHGRVYELADVLETGSFEGTRIVREPGFRTWLGTRHAMPVPLGAGLTWTALAVVMIVQRRRRA